MNIPSRSYKATLSILKSIETNAPHRFRVIASDALLHAGENYPEEYSARMERTLCETHDPLRSFLKGLYEEMSVASIHRAHGVVRRAAHDGDHRETMELIRRRRRAGKDQGELAGVHPAIYSRHCSLVFQQDWSTIRCDFLDPACWKSIADELSFDARTAALAEAHLLWLQDQALCYVAVRLNRTSDATVHRSVV